MRTSEDREAKIEALRRLMDELCAPDLTLPRARVLREQLLVLLEIDTTAGMVRAIAPGEAQRI